MKANNGKNCPQYCGKGKLDDSLIWSRKLDLFATFSIIHFPTDSIPTITLADHLNCDNKKSLIHSYELHIYHKRYVVMNRFVQVLIESLSVSVLRWEEEMDQIITSCSNETILQPEISKPVISSSCLETIVTISGILAVCSDINDSSSWVRITLHK